jgi:hypothetical protein
VWVVWVGHSLRLRSGQALSDAFEVGVAFVNPRFAPMVTGFLFIPAVLICIDLHKSAELKLSSHHAASGSRLTSIPLIHADSRRFPFFSLLRPWERQLP